MMLLVNGVCDTTINGKGASANECFTACKQWKRGSRFTWMCCICFENEVKDSNLVHQFASSG